jgi:hypothetical protein
MDSAEPELLRLVSCRYVVDVLAIRPCACAELRRYTGARRRDLAGAVRAFAAYGAIRRHDGEGSGDDMDTAGDCYALTAVGRRVAAQLEVWTALYAHHLYGTTTTQAQTHPLQDR